MPNAFPQARIHGLNETIRKLKRFEAKVGEDMRMVVAKTATRLEKEARDRCPVRTGNLRDSIKKEIDSTGLEATVGPRKPDGWYAHFLEFGTVKMSARPFMQPAWEAVRPEYVKDVAELIVKAAMR